MDIYINSKKITLSPTKVIGKGGEADIFNIGKNKAVKIFKQPNHPDYQGLPIAQKAASNRLQEHQRKLRQFPSNLPSCVITPEALVTDKQGNNILGYTMPFLKGTLPLLRYSDRNFRTTNGISNQKIIDIFRDLHQTVSQVHQAKVIIGDFNDLNVLVSETKAYLIDADSFQYGEFPCRVFTTRFVDPLLCDPNEHNLILKQIYNCDSDWYAFTVILMQCLLFVDPYGGVYKPKNKQAQIPHTVRPLKRITVFDPEVIYPKPAINYKVLTDDLLDYFYCCFQKDQRGKFPCHLLENLQWKKCTHCGVEHIRLSCPNCNKMLISPSLSQEETQKIIRGTVKSTKIFFTKGIILEVSLVGENLQWIYYEEGGFKREDGTIVFTGDLDQKLWFWIYKNSILVGKQGQIIALKSDLSLPRIAVDSYHDQPMLQCNQLNRYWLHNGQLLRDGQLGEEYIGDVLAGQTQVWVSSHFGFGFYRAANLNISFVFDAKQRGINDQVKLPRFQGEIVDATCNFSEHYCWFLLAIQEQGKILHRVFVIRPDGSIVATTEAEKGDNSWLSTLHGKCAVSNFLLVATDEGIVRVEPSNGQILQTREFPDTESFVDSSCKLFATTKGLYVVNQQQINLLQISN